MQEILFHQEVEVWYLLPAIKREIAKFMKKTGMKQKDIAMKLHMTEAAVSNYMKEKRASEVKFDAGFSKDIENAANQIIAKDSYVDEVEKLCRKFRSEKKLCKLHRKFSKIPLRCSTCGQSI